MKHKEQWPPLPDRCYDDSDGTKRVWALMPELERDDSYASEYGGGYRHLRFSVVSVPGYYGAGRPEAKAIRNAGSHHALNDLVLTSQGDRYKPGELYGYGVEYRRVHSVDLDDAARMHGFLKRLYQGLDAIKREHGSCEDYVTFVVRVAQLLKVRYLIVDQDRNSGFYGDGRYEFISLYQSGPKGPIDKLDGYDLTWRLRTMVRDLWTDADREAAAAHQERKAAEEASRKEREAAAEGAA